MFTGIIEETGEILERTPSGDGERLRVAAPLAVSDARHGDSISINGVCLTVIAQDEASFTADVMRQTLEVTTLGGLSVGAPVNVERATALGTRLGGHIVQGHIDGTGEVLEVRPGDRWQVLRIAVPAPLAPLVVDKGSIAIQGVSLTVSAVSTADASADGAPSWLEVSLIPETLESTTLGRLRVGDRVNLETDLVARHIQRLAAFAFTPVPEGGSL